MEKSYLKNNTSGVSYDWSSLILQIGKRKNETEEEKILEYLYEMYKHSDVYDTVYVVSEREFEKMLKWALPKWKEMKQNEEKH